jgi:glutaminyl-tRNA synthetase
VPFSREVYIEADDFMENPPEGFHRLAPGREVRLRYAYFITCDEVVRDPKSGEIVELRCTYDPETRGGSAPDGRKVKGTLHWVSAGHGLPVEARLYDRLFRVPDPEDVPQGQDFTVNLNPASRITVEGAVVEPSVAGAEPGTRYQFERVGYFMTDPLDSRPGSLVFNRIVTLRDTWARRATKGPGKDAGVAGEGKGRGQEGTAEKETTSHAAAGPGTDTGREERDRVRRARPELVEAHRRYREELGLAEEDADILSGAPELSGFFQEALEVHDDPQGVANWMVNELLRETKDRPLSELPVTPRTLAELVALLAEDTISQPVAKEIFAEMVEEGGDPRKKVKERGLEKMSDPDDLRPLVEEVLEAHPEEVDGYREGKTGLLGFFTGQIMRRTRGKADPQTVQRLLREALS